MDVKNREMEIQSKKFKEYFKKYVDIDTVDINYSRIDIKEKQIFTLPSNYEWHLIYWDSNLDMHLSERLKPGVQTWNQYSDKYHKIIKKTDKIFKVDFCKKNNLLFDIFSINSFKPLSFSDMIFLLNLKAFICDYACRIWKKIKLNLVLPLREKIILPSYLEDSLQEPPYMRFGNIKLTKKEMTTIRYLITHKKSKEIAYLQGCTEAVERKRIMRIKEKFDCKNQSSSAFFDALKKQGVTLGCLDAFITFH